MLFYYIIHKEKEIKEIGNENALFGTVLIGQTAFINLKGENLINFV